MSKIKVWMVVVFLLTFAVIGSAGWYFYSPVKSSNTQPSNCPASSNQYLNIDFLEIADTETEQANGLMNRENICENYAMLFIFPEPRMRSFWMKNTLLSLDIIFLDEQGKILNIHSGTTPKQLYPTYDSKGMSRYVLEAKAGFAQRQNLKDGDIIDIEKLLQKKKDYGTQV